VANCHDFISAFPQVSFKPLVIVQCAWDHHVCNLYVQPYTVSETMTDNCRDMTRQ
jgi:hypothetical protein